MREFIVRAILATAYSLFSMVMLLHEEAPNWAITMTILIVVLVVNCNSQKEN